jgi:c-di-GMP-binding flagellar brake protein YcgR
MNALDALFVRQYVDIEDQSGNMLVAQIEEIGEATFRIGSIVTKYRLPLSGLVSKDVFVFFRDEKGDRYQFKTKVLNLIETSPPALRLALPNPDACLHVQRREYFRVPAAVKLEIKYPGEERRLTYITKDISGGGVSFLTNAIPFNKDMSGLSGELLITGGESEINIPFSARVVYVRPDENGMYHVGLQYEEIRESHRDKIIRYCMREQLKRRKIGVNGIIR